MDSTELKFNPPVLAHRGASAYAPENTLAAFKKAKELGAQWIECDVQLTACAEVVVFHDESLNRTTNGQGKLAEQPYDYLKTLDAGSWFDPRFAQEKIPTLKELLHFLEQNPLSANIELKALPGQEQLLVEKVLAILEAEWPAKLSAPLLSSFSLETLRVLRRYSTSSLIGLLMEDLFPGWEKVAEDLHCASINIDQEVLNPENILLLKARNKPLLSYTVNSLQRALELFSWGVNAVFTDYPDRIIGVRSPSL